LKEQYQKEKKKCRKTLTTIFKASFQKHRSWQLYGNEKNGLQQFQVESCQPIKRLEEEEEEKEKEKEEKKKKEEEEEEEKMMMTNLHGYTHPLHNWGNNHQPNRSDHTSYNK